MKLNTEVGLIALEHKRDIQRIDDLYTYLWEFFDATDYESHLLRNEEVFRTVISNRSYSGIWAEDDIYQLELNRRLIDIAWLYLECLENGEGGEPRPLASTYVPKFNYWSESTYYFDDHSSVSVNQDGRPNPFAARESYKEVIARFKGKVRWLTLAEIVHPHWLYEQLFEKRSYPQWLEVLDTWSEYTLLGRSICEKLDGGDVYDTFVIFQKLTEMAYLLHKHGMFIPDTSSVRYYDYDEYPAFLHFEHIMRPYFALYGIFLERNATELKNDFNWWMDRAVQKVDVLDSDATHRLCRTFMKAVKLLEACWVIKHADAETQKSWKEDFMRPDIKPIKTEDGICDFLLNEEERSKPVREVGRGFYRQRIGAYRDDLLECYETTFERKEWHIKPEAIEKLRASVSKIIEAAYLILLAQYDNKDALGLSETSS